LSRAEQIWLGNGSAIANQSWVSVACTKTGKGKKRGALFPSLLGESLEAEHEAKSIRKIRNIQRREVEDSKKGFLEIYAPSRVVILSEIRRCTITPLLARHLLVPTSRAATLTSY